MLTSHTPSKEEMILYLRKFAHQIRNNNEGPQLTSMRFIASGENVVPRFQTSQILPFPPHPRTGFLIPLKKVFYSQCWGVLLQFLF